MRNHVVWRRFFLSTAGVVSLAVLVVLGPVTAALLLAQLPLAQAASAQAPVDRPAIPQWQSDAGGKMAFDVTSVRPNKSNDQANSNFPLGPGDGYAPNGGLFTATNQPLIAYIGFVYKLRQSDLPGLRAWVYDDRFDIEARTDGNPTKDQMRLMMQSLLADRFKLAVHTAIKQGPVFALVLGKPGKTGPQLQRDAKPCSAAPAPQTLDAAPAAAPSAPTSTSGLQLPEFPCGNIGPIPASTPERGRLGGRDVTMGRIAGFLKNPFTGVDRPVVDRTGLTGTFDFSLEWSPEPDAARPPGSQSEDTGPAFLEALQEQLGLKLKPTTGPVDVLVIDHVEGPSAN
jgi:uncharacterized protein (TIGR03435 family)